MNSKNLIFIASVSIIAGSCGKNQKPFPILSKFIDDGDKPNIIFIYADDLGYGDIGCFGAKDIKTPNIDRLAREGIQFNAFYSASPVCSPSRAALMTGRYPQRMGINSVFFPESYTGLPTDEITIADLLKRKDYATGIVGKWHLGHMPEYLPLQNGFDEYFGIPYSNDMESVVYMRGNEVEEFHVNQQYTTKKYTDEALRFIENHKTGPFFLYIAHNMPHVPIYASPEFMGTSERGLYGDVIQELDWSVGQVLQKLEKENILENTLVVFSSDNGPWLVMKEHGGSSGILREGKQYTFEGGMRVPTLAMWKGRIKPGTVSNEMACMMDWLPTFCTLTGADLPQDKVIDGKDISGVLFGTGKRENQDLLYFDLAILRAYRSGKWKVKLPFEGFPGARWKEPVEPHPQLLINLEEDPGETNNLAPLYPDTLEMMLTKMEKAKEALGELPPSLVIKTNADESHYDYLTEKYGEKYWLVEQSE
ncbi:MAG: sulfatase [Bacteroidota bacterium]